MFTHVDIPSGFVYSGVWALLIVKYIQRRIIQSTPPVKTMVTVSKRLDDYMAVINGRNAIWGCGPTPAVVVMDVLTRHPEQHDIEFDVQKWWVTADSPSTTPFWEQYSGDVHV